MASSNRFQKKSLRQKFASVAGKAARGVAVLAVAGGIGYYEYGTQHTEIVKATITDTNTCYADDYNGDYNDCKDIYTLTVVDGQQVNDNVSRLHNKWHGGKLTEKVYNQLTGDSGDDYTGNFEIKYYGLHIPGLITPNMTSIRHLTDAQMKQIKADAAAAAKKKAEATAGKGKDGTTTTGTTTTTPAGGTTGATGALSGKKISYDVTVNGYTVNITVPVEAVSGTTVNAVTPPAAAAKPAAAPAP